MSEDGTKPENGSKLGMSESDTQLEGVMKQQVSEDDTQLVDTSKVEDMRLVGDTELNVDDDTTLKVRNNK